MRFEMKAFAAVALGAGAIVTPCLVQAATKGPTMGGGYTNVTPIPVDDPVSKQIAGALFKPEGKGPFPAVVYMPGCGGPNFPLDLQNEKLVISRMQAKGIATFIV